MTENKPIHELLTVPSYSCHGRRLKCGSREVLPRLVLAIRTWLRSRSDPQLPEASESPQLIGSCRPLDVASPEGAR